MISDPASGPQMPQVASKKKPTFKTAKAKLDKQFSLWIQDRDAKKFGGLCQLCGPCRGKPPEPIAQNFHWITRAHMSTRFDPDFCSGSCAGCNYLMEFQPARFYDYFIKTRGISEFERMNAQARQIKKYSVADLLELCERFKV